MNKPNRPYIPKDYDVKTSMEAKILGMFIQTGTGDASMPAISVMHAKMETFGSAEKEVMEAIYAGGHHGINYDDFVSVVTTAKGIDECIKFLIEEKIIVADVTVCKELALSLPAYLLMSGTKIKSSLRYIPENYSHKNSTAVLFDGMDLDKNNPVVVQLMVAAGNKYLALGEVAKVLLMHLYRGFHNRLTYETLFDKAKRQIKGPGPANAFFIDKVASSTQQLFTEDLIYLSKDEGDELVLSPILRLVFDNDPAMRGSVQDDITTNAKADDAPNPFMFIGNCGVTKEQAGQIFKELSVGDIRAPLYVSDLFSFETKVLPGMAFDKSVCITFIMQYVELIEKDDEVEKNNGVSIKLNTITDKVSDAEAINLPDSCMFFGAVLKGFEVPPGELKKVYDQLMVFGNFYVEFGDTKLEVTLEESVEFIKAYRAIHHYVPYSEQHPGNKPDQKFPMMSINLIGTSIAGTANVPNNSMFVGAVLAERVVPPHEMRSVYNELMNNPHIVEAFTNGGIIPNSHKTKVNFGGADWNVRLGEVYNFVVCYRQLTELLGMNVWQADSLEFKLGVNVIKARDFRKVYDLVREDRNVKLYRNDEDGEDFAHHEVIVSLDNKDITFTAAQGSNFMDMFKKLKSYLKKQ